MANPSLTDKQRAALKVGERIRNIVCMDSIARRHFDPDFWSQIREVCDEQMHRLGFESLTEHNIRRTKVFEEWNKYEHMGNREFGRFMRYQRLPLPTERDKDDKIL